MKGLLILRFWKFQPRAAPETQQAAATNSGLFGSALEKINSMRVFWLRGLVVVKYQSPETKKEKVHPHWKAAPHQLHFPKEM